MKNLLLRGVAVLAASLVVSCVSPTPASRIADSPWLYDRLPERQRELVRQGKLERGMSPDAVWLAWGEPAQRFEGWEKGKATLRWDYAGIQPVYTTGFGGSLGWGGYGRWGGPYRHGYAPYSSFGMGPEIAYVPYHRASAWFANKCLEAWSSAR
jgi:hypothetical protein